MHIQTTRAFVLLSALSFLVGNGCNSSPDSGGAGDGDRSVAAAPAESNAVASPPAALTPERVYEVHKKVCDFPPGEDLSTPEAAYATVHRAYAAKGEAAWEPLNSPEIVARGRRRRFQPPNEPLPPKAAQRFLNAEILEVHIWDQDHAMVMARMPRKGYDIDCRSLARVKGRWLNEGNDCARTIDEARQRVAAQRAYQAAQQARENRPAVADPAARLQPFVEFLKREAKNPQQFLLEAIGKHRLVILGEIHNRPRYWAFNAALVREPEFARRAGVIYLELPSNDQPLVDRFLAAAKYDPEPVIDTLRDMMEFGWPDQPTLDFFRAVWEVNQKLPAAERLRIVLADMARPWKEINSRDDWAKCVVDRDRYMADSILRDLATHEADQRHALFIVGYGHAMLNLTWAGGEPMKSAGWHLREKLGAANVFAMFPHGPVITNQGQVSGRIALGLFDTAFAALGNKPIAFPLDHGPFGEQLFDADPERLTADPYRKGYNGYLCLGPVEGEIFSPPIPGFYTDAFVREMDRRLRVLGSKGLVESGLIPRLDGASFTAMRSQFWGQPRWEWCGDHLGPLDAWKYGSHFRDARRKRVPSPPATTGKVIELSDVSSGLASMANLAKGTIIAPDRSRFRGDNPERIAWLREQAIDLIAYARADNGDEGVAGYDMAAAKIDNRRFDALDATEAQHALGQIKKNPPFTLMSTKRELPVTYVIRTRAGTVGVLQIEDVRSSQAPTVFRLRYKLFDTP